MKLDFPVHVTLQKNFSSLVLSAAVCSLLVGAAFASAGDWPQYRGANHDGICTEQILATWTTPREVWKTPTPGGFSCFAVGGGRVCTLVLGGGEEVCVAFDAATGKQLWAQPLGSAKYDGGGDNGTKENRGGDGPRSTPTIDGDRVYVLTAQLSLFCLDAGSGKEIWKKDLCRELGGKMIRWQSAASPVMDGDLIFVCGGDGGALAAINKKDGKVAWKGAAETLTHASPIVATILGVKQVIFFVKSGLVAVEPATGKELWRYAFPFKVSTAASPVVSGDIVYCSAGYGVGSAAAKIAKAGGKFTAKELWRTEGNTICNHWSTPVLKDGYLYGPFSFKQFGIGPLKCVEVATGKEMWSKDGFGPGGVVLVGNNFLALSDTGKLVLIEASPKGYKQLGEFQAIGGKCWNTFAISNGRVYLRSTTEGACLDVAGK
ncbi:MAG: PQQ-binding-like beta-propeller repeat protein [Verrucomicrobia bacterium]|nr:PQQ-binding-like beta-propeller repeat protein [Verrucomicrobiota bacterium]